MIRLLQIILLLLPAISIAQIDTVVNIYSFGGVSNDVAEEIKATTDGGYVVIGSTSSNSWGNTDAYLLKIDSNCTYQWSKALGGANNDWGYAIEETHDKGFIIAVTSNSYGNGGYNAVLMKKDSMGNFEWTKAYGGNDWDFVYDVTQTYDSGYAFCGETYNNTSGFSDVYVVRTNVNGDTLWTRTVGGALVDRGNAIIETQDSSLVIAGITHTTTDSTQLYVLKFSNTGTLLWDSIYGDSLHEYTNDIIELTDGNFVIAAHTTSHSVAGDQDYLIKCVDPNGGFLWDFVIVNGPVPTPDDEDAFTVMQLPNAKILVTGYSKTGGSSKNVIFYHLSPAGSWAGGSNVIGTNQDDYIVSATMGVNGDMVFAGVTETFGAGLQDVLVLKLDTIYSGQDTSSAPYLDVIPLRVPELSSDRRISVFPNPNNGTFTVENVLDDAAVELVITDVSGQQVPFRIENNQIEIKVKNPGVFFLKAFRDDQIFNAKIIKY
ncbi:MAG: T9SS type A sorting domain-containing protein [Flavobacteriales bacterium]|nr:T9SS type A sorting domain-containing protein [Flavobacteriales bacterium]